MRVSRAERARQLVAVVSVAVMTPAFSVASAAPSETGPVSFVQQLSPLIPIIAAGLGGLVGLLSGIFLERGKAQRADQRLFLETRMRLWLDTASGFSAYLLSWSRLIAIARHEQSSEGLSELEQERKNTYVEERNRARQQLYCCMDQAFLFFSSDVLSKIDDFRAFDDRYRIATLEALPPHEAWRRHQTAILHAMKREVGAK